MGFLNKNAVAARQLPVLAHQRIFAVSAYLHGIMDTAQNGRVSDYTGCVPAFAHRQTPAWAVVSPQLKMGGYRITPAVSLRLPIGKRLSWAVVSPQLKMGGYRITPAVSLRLPIGKRLSWAVVSPQLKMGGYRITPAVSPRLPIGKRLSWAVVSPQLKMGRPDSQYAGLNPLFFQERLQALGFHHF